MKIDFKDSQDAPSSSQGLVSKKKPMPFWFKLIGSLAIVALICVTGGIIFTESWGDVVDSQLKALRQHDIKKAYTSYTSKDFQKATSLQQFEEFVAGHPVLLKNESAYFTKRSIKDHLRTLRGNLISSDRIHSPVEYKLIKEDDRWKILSMRFLKTKKGSRSKEADHAGVFKKSVQVV